MLFRSDAAPIWSNLKSFPWSAFSGRVDILSGGYPCQPFSAAGKRLGTDDERHLWPAFQRLIAECLPSTCFGEQVASDLGREWFAGVRLDLEALGYACGGADLCAAGVGAPHKRQRLYWVAMADAVRSGRSGRSEAPERIEERGTAAQRVSGDVVDAESNRRGEGRSKHEVRSGRATVAGTSRSDMADADGWDSSAERLQRSGFDGFQSPDRRDRGSAGNDQLAEVWNDVIWLPDSKGKLRRIKPGLRLLVDGFPGRVGHIRIAGNAIVPQVAATFMRAAQ